MEREFLGCRGSPPLIHICKSAFLSAWQMPCCAGLCAVGGRTNSDKNLSSPQQAVTSWQQQRLGHHEMKSGRQSREWAPVATNSIFLELFLLSVRSQILLRIRCTLYGLSFKLCTKFLKADESSPVQSIHKAPGYTICIMKEPGYNIHTFLPYHTHTCMHACTHPTK